VLEKVKSRSSSLHFLLRKLEKKILVTHKGSVTGLILITFKPTKVGEEAHVKHKQLD